MNTSYFANLINVKNPLSICGKAPEWYTGPQFKVLAPKYDFFIAYKNGIIDEAGYVEQFKLKVLALLDPVEIYQRLLRLYGEDVSLLCYEAPGDFCHRHIVAQWLSQHNNVAIDELEPPLRQIKGVEW